jgi:hypothetical protein
LDKQNYENKVDLLEKELIHSNQMITYYQNNNGKNPILLLYKQVFIKCLEKNEPVALPSASINTNFEPIITDNATNYNKLEALLLNSQKEIDTLNDKINQLQNENIRNISPLNDTPTIAQVVGKSIPNIELKSEKLPFIQPLSPKKYNDDMNATSFIQVI